MRCFRLHKARIGVFVAVMLFAAAGLPGVLAAAQGVQLQAPICGPGSKDLPMEPGPAAQSHNDHCKIFPCGGAFSIGARAELEPVVVRAVSSADIGPMPQNLHVGIRAELTPLNGRAPPSIS